MSSKLSVIIVAAGSGSRFGGEKQTALLQGLPLFLHSVRHFLPLAFELAVVVPPGRIGEFRQLAAQHGIQNLLWAEGGATRTESVRHGLACLTATTGFVAIHDAARPLATAELLRRVWQAAETAGGAVPGHPVVDTMLRCNEQGVVTEPISRQGAWAVSTPQVFDLERLRNAYARLGESQFTDDSQAFMAMGGTVAMVEETTPNLKVTYPGDLETLCSPRG